MKKISLIMVLLFVGAIFSQPSNGSYSLMHTQSARTFEKGRLEIHSSMNFYTKAYSWVGDAALEPAEFKADNMWLVAGDIAITYGILDNFDVTIAPRIYQDTHYSNEYNLPGDIFLTLKAGSFAFAKRRLYGAMLLNIRLGIGEQHNYPYTEYASGAVEYGFTGALSYYMDPYLPDRAINAHLNLGWWNHNEAGEDLYRGRTATKNSSELQYALGFVYPTGLFDFRMELNGIVYTNQPDTMVFSRENWLYITPSIRYKPLSWVSLDLGIDIRLTGGNDETKISDRQTTLENLGLANYAPWKVYMGLNLTLLPLAPSKRSTAEVEKEEFNKRVEFFQKIVEERERSEEVQEELERLKEEREAAERELEELKQILQEEGR